MHHRMMRGVPELPEVETARRQLRREITGARVVKALALDPKMCENIGPGELERGLTGKIVEGIERHGKNLFLDLGGSMLHIHLGMSGSLHVLSGWDRRMTHERLRLELDSGTMVFDDPRRFGRYGLTGSVEDFVAKKGLGPDALSVDGRVLLERLNARRGTIKPLLLDQRVVAGIGNLYADELLFQLRVHPRTPVAALSPSRIEAMGERGREVLRASIEAGTDFSLLPDGYLLRDRSGGAPCPRCSAPLTTLKVGGRTSVICPACQACPSG